MTGPAIIRVDARAMQDRFDTEAAHLRARRLRHARKPLAIRPEGEPSLLAGVAMLAGLFIFLTFWVAQFGGAA